MLLKATCETRSKDNCRISRNVRSQTRLYTGTSYLHEFANLRNGVISHIYLIFAWIAMTELPSLHTHHSSLFTHSMTSNAFAHSYGHTGRRSRNCRPGAHRCGGCQWRIRQVITARVDHCQFQQWLMVDTLGTGMTYQTQIDQSEIRQLLNQKCGTIVGFIEWDNRANIPIHG